MLLTHTCLYQSILSSIIDAVLLFKIRKKWRFNPGDQSYEKTSTLLHELTKNRVNILHCISQFLVIGSVANASI